MTISRRVVQQSENFEIPIVQQLDFLEDLSQQLNEFDLEEKEQNIAEEIIWNLDENGYLSIDTILISDHLGISEDEVERILFLVQQLNPPGIAARNLQECLIQQVTLLILCMLMMVKLFADL